MLYIYDSETHTDGYDKEKIVAHPPQGRIQDLAMGGGGARF